VSSPPCHDLADVLRSRAVSVRPRACPDTKNRRCTANRDHRSVDAVRVGRSVRALRRRRGWRQVDLAHAADVSQSMVSRIERGEADRLPPRALDDVVEALGARLRVQVEWNGEALDRLLDADHAWLMEQTIGRLRNAGWESQAEVTFAIYGERGSIDILAWHPASRIVLVIEVKTVVPDVQAMLAALDRKRRLGTTIASTAGWRAAAVGCLLVIRQSRTSRRRIEAHSLTFAAQLPDRAMAVRRWIVAPSLEGPLRGLVFLSGSRHTTARHRVAAPRSAG
jgi:transcriptional regulator with XRE-family HTH domain